MILIHYDPNGLKRTTDLRDIYHGRTAILLGGAPSLNSQLPEQMERRGVLIMAMNNAAMSVRPAMMCCGDHPDCYEPQILEDPTIMKFGPTAWAEQDAVLHGANKKFHAFPNMFFYVQAANRPWDEYFAERPEVPWYNNTLFVAIHLLYQFGIRRIILAGSDFMFNDTAAYASGQRLGSLEQRWNLDLYNHLVRELRLLKPLFDKAGLQLLDASFNSRLSPVYPHITLEAAVEMCLEGFPAKRVDPQTLPHCSKYAPRNIKEAIAQWPGQRAFTDTRHEPEKHVGIISSDGLQLML